LGCQFRYLGKSVFCRVSNFVGRISHTQGEVHINSSRRKVDFIFDERAEKTPILEVWDEYLAKKDDHVRKQYGAAPRFEDDQQAADLWAWWVREWYEEDASPVPDKLQQINFGLWRGKPRRKVILDVTEEHLIDTLTSVAVELFAQGDYIVSNDLGPILPDNS